MVPSLRDRIDGDGTRRSFLTDKCEFAALSVRVVEKRMARYQCQRANGRGREQSPASKEKLIE